MTTVSSSNSPCLLYILYSFDISQMNQKDIKLDQLSLPINDSSSKSICRVQNYSSDQILTDITMNTSIRSSFLKSPIHRNVLGPVLDTSGYLNVGPHVIISNILNYRFLWSDDDDDNQLLEDAINVIKGLLNYDSILRFQLDDLKKDSISLNIIDWNNLANVPPPFISIPDNDSDTFYFVARNKAIGFNEESIDNMSL
ncbi:unnamed protein product [Rotaria sordida]|uniref:AGC-kinase C-terminal domain-containing protein n=1 Tax=Rotaria sordida TaxID=392033 RepID=A0A814DVJ5_9BILA|nr:unnamed protein product [Rotaria sordida]